jgi:hypothetical protein
MSVWGRFRDDRMIGGRRLTASLILTAAYAAHASAQSSVAPALVRPAPIPAPLTASPMVATPSTRRRAVGGR